jgi:predicted phosphodiesterase
VASPASSHITASAPPIDARSVRMLGIIGDVHTESELLRRALTELDALGAELVLCVGDIADGPGDLLRCCTLLKENQVPTVRGNHDRWLVADLDRSTTVGDQTLPHAVVAHLRALAETTPMEVRQYLSSLPPTRTIETPAGRALLCHGLGDNDMAAVFPDQTFDAWPAPEELIHLQADPAIVLVFNGHSHHRMVRHFPALTIVNAGTLHPMHEPGVVLVDFITRDVLWLDFGTKPTITSKLGSLST